MELKAINCADALNFQGRTCKKENKKQIKLNNCPNCSQHTSPASRRASNAMRNTALGLMMATATVGTLGSCEKDVMGNIYNFNQELTDNDSIYIGITIGGNCDHHDTTTVVHDTIINTEIKPVFVKDYPFHIADSLISQAMNIDVPIDGPVPDGSGLDSVVYVGSKAHNRFDNIYYESMVDSVGTNKRELAVVTKVLDLYNTSNPKTSYMKSLITDVPGRGIKITRYVANTAKKPEDDEQYLWNYAGYEIRSNGKDGIENRRYIFDNNNNLIYQGNIKEAEDPITFTYGLFAIDPETGEPYYDEDGNPEFITYNFDQAVVYSDYAKRSEDYEYPGWAY